MKNKKLLAMALMIMFSAHANKPQEKKETDEKKRGTNQCDQCDYLVTV